MTATETTVHDMVASELRWDSSINAGDIRISSNGGAITLRGRVTSFPQKVAAEKAAKRIRGVIAVANEIEVQLPVAARRDDAEIEGVLARDLTHNIQANPGAVTAAVHKGWVVLNGTVSWAYQKATAERIARHVAGVTGITNEIRVQVEGSSQHVENEIRAALHRRADLDPGAIQVSVEGSVVTLRGTVSTLAEEHSATSAAAAAPGIERVASHLTVQPSSTSVRSSP